MWTSAFIEKTSQRTEHVLHWFYERTVINIWHVVCWCRATALWRRRPPPTRAASCSRALPLASDAVAFFLPVITTHTQFWDSGIGIFPFSGEPRNRGQERAFGTIWNARKSSCLVIPTLLCLHTQARALKTTFACGPTFSLGLYFPVCLYFGRLFLECVSDFFYVCFCARASLCLFLNWHVCARASLHLFVYLYVRAPGSGCLLLFFCV